MTDPTPTFSVIVVCKNPGDRLRAALRSVWDQRWTKPELIVVDGGSTDGAREWLESEKARIDTLISEPDRGVYQAMNKGLAAATGTWVIFLGADDRFDNDMALSATLEFMHGTEAGVVCGEARYDDGRLYHMRSRPNPPARNFLHHQSTFYRRALFAENGVFDESLAVMGDYDFNLRLWKQRVRFKPIKLRIAECRSGGLSDGGSWRVYREEITVRHRYFPAWRCWLWDLASVVRFVRKQIIRR